MSTPMDSNREHWDEATDIHARGNVYGIEDFKAGRCQLHRIEVEELVASYLEPGGIFYIAEAHPFIRVFPTDDDITDGSTELRPRFSYFHDPAGTLWPPAADYTDTSVSYTTPEHIW